MPSMSQIGYGNPLQSDPIAPSESISTICPTQSSLPIGILQFSTPESGNFAIWSPLYHNTFLKWWKTTPNGLKDIKPALNWAKKGNSKVWSYIEQLAEVRTGLPKVRCIACNQLLNHPSQGSGSSLNGTSTVLRHIKRFCDSRVISPSQSSIESSLAFAAVSFLPFCLISYPFV